MIWQWQFSITTSDGLLLDLTVYHCLSLHQQWMLVDKWWPKFRMSIQFQQHCGGQSAVMCGCFRSTCMPQHSQRSEWKNTGCHRKLEPYLAVIFRHCAIRDPNNQIPLRSPIYSPAMLIKWLRYRHESSSYPARKEALCLHQSIRTRYGVSFVGPAPDWYSVWVPTIICAISYYIGPCYNGTQLY